jgi:hypothetical protein
MAHVTVVATGCWEWNLRRNQTGYGRISHRSVTEAAHRYAFIASGGTFEDGPYVLHSCDNPRCVNPAHLRAGTNGDNMADRMARGRYGHGETNGRAKLTEPDVAQIRARRANGERLKAIASDFNVSDVLVSLIARGKNWKRPAERKAA